MSETGPQPDGPHGARWVKAKVVGEEPESPPPPHELDDAPTMGTKSETCDTPPEPPVTDDELAAARWFSIAFLVVVVPLGLVLLGVIVWGFVRSVTL